MSVEDKVMTDTKVVVTDQPGKADEPAADATKPADKGAGAEGSKDSGKEAADLAAQNAAQLKVNRDLEEKLNQLRDGLKAALGIEDKKDGDTGKLVAALQDQLNSLSHNNLVNEVARRHKITDDEDLALLSNAKDQEAMDKLAARLAPQGGDGADGSKKTSGKPGMPKPDPSQGRGDGKSGAKPTSVAQVMADRAAAREKK